MYIKLRQYITSLGIVLTLGLVRVLIPERPMDYTGPRALLDIFFAFGLLIFVLLTAAGIGKWILLALNLPDLSLLEQYVFGIALGLGVLAYSVLALGLKGWLTTRAITVGIGVFLVWRISLWPTILNDVVGGLRSAIRRYKLLSKGWKIAWSVGIAIGVLSLINTLVPPWAYDTLMYHLQAPRVFLQAKRIAVMPEFFETAFPLTTEMLFTVGLAYQSDIFAGLVNFVFAVLLLLGTLCLGKRILQRNEPYIALAILVGTPAFPLWATLGYTDMSWALYAILSLYAVIIQSQSEHRPVRYLILAGLMAGLAAGSKYSGLGWIMVLTLIVFLEGVRASWRQAILHAAILGIVAIVVGSPWYIKNWVQAENPIFPLVFGGPGWDAVRLELLRINGRSYGVGTSFWDFILLPWNLYANAGHFTGFAIEIPSLLFPLGLIYFLFRRDRTFHLIALATVVYTAIWFFHSQQARYYLAMYPLLSILTTVTLCEISRRFKWKKYRSPAISGLFIGLLTLSFSYQGINMLILRSPLVLVGLESKDEFLHRIVFDYKAKVFIQENILPNDRVLMLWDGQGYYCDQRCIPDADKTLWLRLKHENLSPVTIARRIRLLGANYILFSNRNVGWFIKFHDPTRVHSIAIVSFLDQFAKECTKEVYNDTEVVIYELTCY